MWSVVQGGLSWGEARDILLTVAGVCAALGVVYRFAVRPIVRFGLRLERVMTSVEDQLYPNGGASLRDAVTSLQVALGVDPKLPSHNPPEERRAS